MITVPARTLSPRPRLRERPRLGRGRPDASAALGTLRPSPEVRSHSPYFTQVHAAVDGGGKVLIPSFAVGRAQELLLLLDAYWERMGLTVPIYFATAMVVMSKC